jgi:two-component system, OmpR family, KDP operon response regulator KdpE
MFSRLSVPAMSKVRIRRNRTRIVVVDDDSQFRRAIRTVLDAEGYEVDEAGSGERALELVGSAKCDLVLLDINLPGKTGIETCKEIRTESNLPIIMLSVRNAMGNKIEALDAGAQDYVTKPFAMRELLARIRSVLRRTASSASSRITRLQLGNAEVDFEARRVIVSGKQVRLTGKEFDLLLYLACNANKTIPHRQLLREVWGSEYTDERKYLRVFINRVRKKIESSPREPAYLRTEPFVGYRLQITQ